MALFQIYKGSEASLSRVRLHEGYAYFCEDTGKFFIDISNGITGDETNQYRIPLNSQAANGLMVDGSFLNAENFATLEAFSKAYTVTITVTDWIGQNAPYTYTYENANLKCGKNGDIPPLITCVTNNHDYSFITSAVATAGSGIVFTTDVMPEGDIVLVITDIG